MGMYRTSTPMIVDAVQCAEAKTIATDLGFINVKRGEWIICGEGGECYVADDAFFRRTFISLQNTSQIPAATKTGLRIRSEQVTNDRVQIPVRACFHRERMPLKSHAIRRRKTSGSRKKIHLN